VDLCLCGHIHEAWGIERSGGTIIANGGSFKKGRYVCIDLDGNIKLESRRVIL
jgi:Icc-related predicted phosphoesterase